MLGCCKGLGWILIRLRKEKLKVKRIFTNDKWGEKDW